MRGFVLQHFFFFVYFLLLLFEFFSHLPLGMVMFHPPDWIITRHFVLTMTSCVFSNNDHTSGNGIITLGRCVNSFCLVDFFRAASISASEFRDNRARNGGAIFVDVSPEGHMGTSLVGNKFINNFASEDGGAIFGIPDESELLEISGTFFGNKARMYFPENQATNSFCLPQKLTRTLREWWSHFWKVYFSRSD